MLKFSVVKLGIYVSAFSPLGPTVASPAVPDAARRVMSVVVLGTLKLVEG